MSRFRKCIAASISYALQLFVLSNLFTVILILNLVVFITLIAISIHLEFDKVHSNVPPLMLGLIVMQMVQTLFLIFSKKVLINLLNKDIDIDN